MLDSHEQYIERALKKLGKGGQARVPAVAGGAEPDQGETLLQGIDFLVNNHLVIREKFERLQRELEVFKEVSADANFLLERKIEEISLLRLITDTSSRAMRTQDPLKLIVGKVIAIMGAENGAIMLRNGAAENLEVRAASGPGDPQFGPALKIARRVMDTGEPHFIDDISAEPESEEASRTGSLASFPLIFENNTIGAVNLSSPNPNAFGAETQRIMHIIAGQIAVAVENARLYGEVRKTKEYLENLVEKAGDAIFTLDQDHRISSWNKSAEAIFKRDKKGVLGRPFYELMPESMAPMLSEKIRSTLDLENIVTIDTDLEHDQETRTIITLSPIHGAEGEVVGVSGIAKDMTKHSRLDDELRQLNEAKSSFVATVSHELRTPLTSIKSLTEVLSHDMESLPRETITRYFNIINEECDRLSGLISGLLDLQKLSAGRMDIEFEKVRLADIVRQAVELFDGIALQNKIEMTTDLAIDDHASAVMGDREQLLRILANLLSNAVKYSGPGDRVGIRLFREGDDVGFEVTDAGIGIPADQKIKVFEKFYQVDNPVTRDNAGTGLGLAITKELVTLHGGRIWVEDAHGGGCAFKALFPAVESAPGGSDPPA
jgi:PAS domain S-box-containing protein